MLFVNVFIVAISTVVLEVVAFAVISNAIAVTHVVVTAVADILCYGCWCCCSIDSTSCPCFVVIKHSPVAAHLLR